MNAYNTAAAIDFKRATQDDLLGMGLAPLHDVADSMNNLREALNALCTLGNDSTVKRAERLMRQLDGFEPSVTMVGQIKSGKTSLVNALIGRTDLLPADVNPWTSVVTSMHLKPQTPGFKNGASFRFFDEDEWDRLISGGGRIGELASRAGANDELAKIKAQAASMREKSLQRLGQKFEMLLGQQRDYGYFDKDLIERYVCLGETFDAQNPDVSDEQGRFADITKSADLFMERAALPVPLCLRDTPGVNDTFMMREQITIRSIRESRLCVVVLSAHQALSSTDLALIRLISQVKSRDVVIFVNRIDELADPAAQIPQIAQSIEDTLALHRGPEDAQVIFGSALWAGHALDGRLADLPKTSADALLAWSSHADLSDVLNDSVPCDPNKLAWSLSGVPALQLALSERIAQGIAQTSLQRVGKSASNLTGAIVATQQMQAHDASGTGGEKMSSMLACARLSEISSARKGDLNDAFSAILAEFSDRMDRVQASFLNRATSSLIVHLEKYGEETPWSYDPTGLRMLLGSSHTVLARKSKAAFNAVVQQAAQDHFQLYQSAFGLSPDQIGMALPTAPQVPAPVSLGRTIALDLNGSWWRRWWLHRRGYKAYAANFYELIKVETNPFVQELRDDLAQSVKETSLEALDAFLDEQKSVFATLDEMAQSDPAQLKAFMANSARPNHKALLDSTLEKLSEYAS